jgi:hypothetical protein
MTLSVKATLLLAATQLKAQGFDNETTKASRVCKMILFAHQRRNRWANCVCATLLIK